MRAPGASATPLADRLTELGFAALAPGRTIVNAPRPLEANFRNPAIQAPQLLRDLMHNFYTYGRGAWSWTASSTNQSADGGLVKGTTNWGAERSMTTLHTWQSAITKAPSTMPPAT